MADVEGVHAHELPRRGRVDVARAAVAGAPELLARSLRQQAGGARRLLFEHGQRARRVPNPTRRSRRCTVLGATRSSQVRAR
jgi:hypothetical protein